MRADSLADVPRETGARLEALAELVRTWSRVKNLVAASTLDDIWGRHIADSWQVADAAPDAIQWLDLGSGAGFPGLVIAIRLATIPGALVQLVESDQRKAAFLRAAIRALSLPAVVHAQRIEIVLPTIVCVDAVSARAVAPLTQLLRWTVPLIERGAVGVFPKGRGYADELHAVGIAKGVTLSVRPSLTDPEARLVIVRRASGPALDEALGAASPDHAHDCPG